MKYYVLLAVSLIAIFGTWGLSINLPLKDVVITSESYFGEPEQKVISEIDESTSELNQQEQFDKENSLDEPRLYDWLAYYNETFGYYQEHDFEIDIKRDAQKMDIANEMNIPNLNETCNDAPFSIHGDKIDGKIIPTDDNCS